MRYFIIIFLFLAACDASPNPMMLGGTKTDVTNDGRSYTIYQKGNLFEVVRLGWASPADQALIRQTMPVLVSSVTGCQVSQIEGDSGEMHGTLSCR